MSELSSRRAADPELDAARNNAEAYGELIKKYLPSIRRLAGMYTRVSADRDDLVSEGILGLMSAVKSFESGHGAAFSTYAGVCINNRMLSALKKSSSIKSREESVAEITASSAESPEKIVLDREALKEIFSEAAENLSGLEKAVFSEYLSGEDYEGISEKLGVDKKAVDNALWRVRRKLRKKFR